MLKIMSNTIETGTEIAILNKWRKQITEILKKDDFPQTFKVKEENWGTGAKSFYECVSVNENHKKPISIYLDALVIKYLTGAEVTDCNVGLYFTDYVPMEDTKLLISDKKNPLKILPCQYKAKIEYIDKKVFISFALYSLLDFSEISITSQVRNPWKNLDGTEDYMTDIERMYRDTFIHKGLVIYVCNVVADYLEKEGRKELADELRTRALVHDNSKILNPDEFRALMKMINDKSSLRDAHALLTKWQQESLQLHWEHNDHHPEHWANQDDMTMGARFEFICDCCARSLQFKTNLVSVMGTFMEEKFHFSPFVQKEIMRDVEIVWSLAGPKDAAA